MSATSHDAPPAAGADEETGGLHFGHFLAAWVIGHLIAALALPVIRSAMGVGSEVAADDLPMRVIAVNQGFFYGGMLGVAVLSAYRWAAGPVRAYALRAQPIDLLSPLLGVGFQLLVSLLYYPLYWLTDITADDVERPARELADRASGGGAALFVLTVVIAAPIVEEVLYRGLLFGALRRPVGVGYAVALSAIIFGASHLQPLQFVPLTIFGVVSAYLRLRTGRLAPCIGFHLGFNLLAAVTLLG